MKNSYNKLAELLADESFQRWLIGKSDSKESEYWQSWLKENEENRHLLSEAQNVWEKLRFNEEKLPDLEAELEILRNQIDSRKSKPAPVYHLHKRRKHRNKGHGHFSKRKLLIPGFVAAAIVLFAILFNQFHFTPVESHSYEIVSTDYGERVHLTKFEGATIILNANSTLKYRKPEGKSDNQELNLKLNGEAYFHITKGGVDGFSGSLSVKTADGDIEVVGTRFTVYERSSGTRVAVEEGVVLVKVHEQLSDTAHSALAMFEANQIVRFQRGDDGLYPDEDNILPHITWWQESLRFDQTPFKEIVQRLEETFGIEIEVRGKELPNRTISGSVENSNIRIIADALAVGLGVPVEYSDEKIIFGTL